MSGSHAFNAAYTLLYNAVYAAMSQLLRAGSQKPLSSFQTWKYRTSGYRRAIVTANAAKSSK